MNVAIEGIEQETALMPNIVVDGIRDEIVQFFHRNGDDEAAARMFAFIGADAMSNIVIEKTVAAYNTDKDFRQSLLSHDPRPFYRLMVRQWVCHEIREFFPVYFKRMTAWLSDCAAEC